ncbi:MAG: metalloregulator ArsR/SmtB family transcription factor, partial [Tessaracoccus sp.]
MESLDERVALLKTIADTTRLRILGLIAERPRTGAELAEELSLSAPTISHHLHRMRDVGIIRAERDGQKRIWSINQQLLDNVHAPTPTTTPVDAEQARTLRIFFDGERLRSIPTKRKARVAVLVELLRRFEAGRDYTEREVGDILGRAHDD